MTTVYRNPARPSPPDNAAGFDVGYSGPTKPDTRVPPKAGPVLDAISVNGVDIPEADILGEAQNHPAERPGEALAAAARALVVRELLSQEAQRLGIVGEPEKDAAGRPETVNDAAIRALIDREVPAPVCR
ncbi:MAG: hypothetical protein R3F54_31035 [Alphaproteobacteria bacterium]